MATASSTSASTSTRPAWSPRSAAANCSPLPVAPMTESSLPRTQDQRRIEAERRLVRAAAELVGEIGPGRVTLANVGERAGYRRGLATHHFCCRVVSDLQPVNRAGLVLWADAVAGPSEDVRPQMISADREFREEIEKRIQLAVTAGEVAVSVDPHGLSTVIIAMLRGVALQHVLDDQVDLGAARQEIEQLLTARLEVRGQA